MVAEDPVGPGVDHRVGPLDVLLPRQGVELYPPVDRNKHEVGHLIGGPDRSHHRFDVVAIGHSGIIGGGNPIGPGHHSPEAEHRNTPSVDVEQRRLMRLGAVGADPDRSQTGGGDVGARLD